MEFTYFKDVRQLPHTIGFFVELAQEPGMLGTTSRHHAKQRLVDALSRMNEQVSCDYARGAIGMPTIRVVKPGTFTKYRKWRGEAAKIGTCQMKVPVVMGDTIAQAWIMNRVELEI
ncbi:hypothetical protein DFH29DRAFT_646609 [Suillus ampliporus]|nr:hypothetical protein DFH29DRAFT_646609 [Suillus ampliporus]